MARRWCSFEEEHNFVYGSKLKNPQDWRASVKFGRKPKDSPIYPEQVLYRVQGSRQAGHRLYAYA
jgi:hypothetical protein